MIRRFTRGLLILAIVVTLCWQTFPTLRAYVHEAVSRTQPQAAQPHKPPQLPGEPRQPSRQKLLDDIDEILTRRAQR